jgi:inosine-uridine nucleoside N-ribohydrolase
VFRSPWFWIVVTLIIAGIALTVSLGAFYWLIATLAAIILILAIAFLVAAYAVGRAQPPEVVPLAKVRRSKRIPVILDCDVTIGCPFRDVGDGLALLYLLGETRVDLLGITTTYGNAPVKTATRTVRRLLDTLDRGDIPVTGGAAGPEEEPESNGAAWLLTTTVSAQPGKVILVATGSMTNIKHAAALDPYFFNKLRGLYLLGGLTEPLVWKGHHLAEINFALDPEAAYQAIHADCPVTIATGNAGLSAIFRSPQFAALQALGDPISRLIARKIRFWFALMRLYFRDGGFAMWGSVATLPITHPEMFDYKQVHVISTRDDLRTGRLVVDVQRHAPVRVVSSVRDFERFITAHMAAWQRLSQKRGET